MGRLRANQELTESSLCLLETSSRKSLKLTLGSVAGPGNRGSGDSSGQLGISGIRGNARANRGTHLVCRRVITLSDRINPVQETAKKEKERIPLARHTDSSQYVQNSQGINSQR